MDERPHLHINKDGLWFIWTSNDLRSSSHKVCAQGWRRRFTLPQLGYEPAESGVDIGCAR